MRRYELLDGMRGIAAIAVLLMHSTLGSAWPLLQSADLAVDFFFLLSGFVIAHAYAGRQELGLGGFMLRRLIRLYPLFLIGLLLGAPLLLLSGDYPTLPALESLSVNLLFLPFFNQVTITNIFGEQAKGAIFPANNPAWSLFFEIFANLFFFRLVALSDRRFRWLLAILVFALILVGILLSYRQGRISLIVNGGWMTDNFLGGIPRVLFGFGLGILLERHQRRGDFTRLRQFICRIPSASILLSLALLAVLAMPMIPHSVALYHLLVMLTVAPLILVLAAQIEPAAGPFLALCRALGWLSYPLYCLHGPILRLLQRLGIASYPLLIGSAVIVSLIVAALVTRFFDEPARRFLTRLLLQTRALP